MSTSRVHQRRTWCTRFDYKGQED